MVLIVDNLQTIARIDVWNDVELKVRLEGKNGAFSLLSTVLTGIL